MNWLTSYVRPRIRALVGQDKAEVPENLWHQCESCERMIFHRDLQNNQNVCPHCGHHMRVGPQYRFESLFDAGSWHRIELPTTATDPLKFRDSKRYIDRLKEAQTRTKAQDAIEAAHGTMNELPAVIVAMNFDFMAGSMGTALGQGFITAARLAVLQQAAFIVITASGGARMQEGALSLMQMARCTIAIDEVKEAGLPYIVILTDPTTGGVTASFAMLGDIQISEPGAVIGFAGARVIEQTIRERLPDGFQKAEYLLEHGMIDQVVHRFDMRKTLGTMLDLIFRKRRDHSLPEGSVQDPTSADESDSGREAVEATPSDSDQDDAQGNEDDGLQK
jgi:acetyl-CoA carboxylase carboxyl transferase subunit beta